MIKGKTMTVKTAIQHLVEGNLDKMRTTLNTVISEKAIDALETKKISLAQSYLGQEKQAPKD
jgi:hypothetical protein